jgi:adenylosuccinate synthase
VVQGSQYGSEGKGAVSAAIVERYGMSVAVRTGTINAGHTVYYKGRAYKMQTLPTAWVVPDVNLVLGAGAFISPEVLEREISEVNAALNANRGDGRPTDIRERLWVDRNCGLHLAHHSGRGAESGRRYAIGATGKGCSEAVIDKIRGRGSHGLLTWEQYRHTADCPQVLRELQVTDTSLLLNSHYDLGRGILLEGTQGSHLDLHLGPYPFTTHKQTQATQWMSEAGLGMGLRTEVILVCRTYPIRVAGNSGPMPKETGWPEVARKINGRLTGMKMERLVSETALKSYELVLVTEGEHNGWTAEQAIEPWKQDDKWRELNATALKEVPAKALSRLPGPTRDELSKLFEFTTVTGKLRRVAYWDDQTVKTAIMWNRPKYLVITFFDYWFPELRGSRGFDMKAKDEYGDVLFRHQAELGVPILALTTGPEMKHFLNVAPGGE